MKWLDIVLLALVAAGIYLALRRLRRGGCNGCSGNCAGCAGCAPRREAERKE